MGRRIYITENQFNVLMEQQAICEGLLSNCKSFAELQAKVLNAVKKGIVTAAVIIGAISTLSTLTQEQKDTLKQEVAEAAPVEQWKCIADNVIATVYNATPSQCNNDVRHTASGFELDLTRPEDHKIIAIERTFMAKLGLHYGDVVKIEGTYQGKQDGIYTVQDTMHPKYKDLPKVDILVAYDVKYGGTLKDHPCKMYALNNRKDREIFLQDMLPSKNNIEKKHNDYFNSLDEI